ncbi:hypothetical protein GOP47_0008257 [Adiantum capillus-veneris]|uniref:RRM domain-containing protein n=1 Tax=Adiantum capillus-veneris TaxID=13818 RepID=A0A9D4ZJI1_ADICA|nr:hypothetical protein GOP47_0008257 [Adiantum capillus-veneris]
MAFMPQLTVPPGAFEDVCPPGVEQETKAFAHQAACMSWPSMPTTMEEGPPGVPVVFSINVSQCVPNSFAHFTSVTPLPLQYGNHTLSVLPMPHEGMSSSMLYGSFPHPPLPPHIPMPLPVPPPAPHKSLTPSGPPFNGPRLGLLEETIIVDAARKLSMPDEQKLSIFVGKILPSLDDDIVMSILKLCGPVKSWSRAKDPVTGSRKGFGFCEYESPESLLRALRLLQRLKLKGQELVLKVDKSTLDYLERYVDKKIQSLKPQENAEAESVPGLEAAHAIKQQTPDIPREVPVEERIGWVFDKENEIDKEVCENLVNLLEQRNQIKRLEVPSSMADSGIDNDDDSRRDCIAEADLTRVQSIDWKEFEYDLEKCKLRGQESEGLRYSDSFYLEYEKLWEERERAKETQRKSERERDQVIKKMRKRLIKEQEESRTGWEGLCSDERHKRKVTEKEKGKDCRSEHQSYVAVAASGFKIMDSTHSTKGEALMGSKFLDLSTRAKVAFCFKSSSKLKQSDQTHMSAAGHNGLWEENENTGEAYKETKQMESQFDLMSAIGNDSFGLQEKPTGDDHKQQRHTVVRRSYRNPTFTWDRETTPEEQLPVAIVDGAKESVDKVSDSAPIIPERCKPVNAKELIDKIPRTKDEIFSFCMNWETFDKVKLFPQHHQLFASIGLSS